ncbi:hypothetical protein ACWDTR_15150 [Streptomyces sp. NPDC003470]|uniref:hypothetical protein n=1 Tax=Streptomyces sp. NPDC127100 TaxID=3347138 RepID=UPI003647377C
MRRLRRHDATAWSALQRKRSAGGPTTCEGLLEKCGYEPVREAPSRLRLRNCPFHPLAAKAPDLVCGMNQAFLSGCLTGVEVSGVQAVLAPQPGECCVRLCPNDTGRDDPTPGYV